MLKNCTSPYRSKMMQYEYKKENRKDRYKAKKDIQEGIQEYESGTIFHAHHVYSMMEVYARKDY